MPVDGGRRSVNHDAPRGRPLGTSGVTSTRFNAKIGAASDVINYLYGTCTDGAFRLLTPQRGLR